MAPAKLILLGCAAAVAVDLVASALVTLASAPREGTCEGPFYLCSFRDLLPASAVRIVALVITWCAALLLTRQRKGAAGDVGAKLHVLPVRLHSFLFLCASVCFHPGLILWPDCRAETMTSSGRSCEAPPPRVRRTASRPCSRQTSGPRVWPRPAKPPASSSAMPSPSPPRSCQILSPLPVLPGCSLNASSPSSQTTHG